MLLPNDDDKVLLEISGGDLGLFTNATDAFVRSASRPARTIDPEIEAHTTVRERVVIPAPQSGH